MPRLLYGVLSSCYIGPWQPGNLELFPDETGDIIGKPLNGHRRGVHSVSFFPDGRRLVSGSSDQTIRTWDTQTGNVIGKILNEHKASVNSISVSQDGQKIVSGSSDFTIRIWDAHTGNVIGKPLS